MTGRTRRHFLPESRDSGTGPSPALSSYQRDHPAQAPSGRITARIMGRLWLLATGILLLSSWATQTALAALDEDLQPLPKTSALAGKLGAVGVVIAGERSPALSLATGFLVSPCHVLTAGHVLARVGASAQLGATVRFVAEGGKSGSPPDTQAWGRIVAASPDFVMRDAPAGFDRQNIYQDWGLVELDHPLPGIEPLKLLYPGASIGDTATFSIAGYPLGGMRQVLHTQEHCPNRSHHHGAATGVVLADCAVRAGMSGGPLLLDGSGEPVVAGIVVERFEIGQKVLTVAVPTAAFADLITTAMRASDTCAVGSPFAWPPAAEENR